MEKIEPTPEQTNPYAEFLTPSALVGHLANADPSTVDWRAVAEHSSNMGEIEGAGSLAVLALDRHLKSVDRASRVAFDAEPIDSTVDRLFGAANQLADTSNRVSEHVGGVARNLEIRAQEAATTLRVATSRLEEVMEPGRLRNLTEATGSLEQSLSYSRLQHLQEIAQTLSRAAQMGQNQNRW